MGWVNSSDGVLVEKEILARLKKTAGAVLRALLYPEELTNKSLFGKKSNAHKNIVTKKALDPRRRERRFRKQVVAAEAGVYIPLDTRRRMKRLSQQLGTSMGDKYRVTTAECGCVKDPPSEHRRKFDPDDDVLGSR
ncbi:hypothetical protein HPB49_003356 [Dermacentor silvarum]|uniref:Uncharacterized protein n=1 Tax=Dermacentor silvarum TaxID=543639 RepID=A0ACB8DTM3_DERSI|nr:hypothetical protein HPB49_003356 [Dermacentor silvarum]